MTTPSSRPDRTGATTARLARWGLALFLLLSVALPTTLPAGTARAEPLAVSLRNPAPGPRGAISVIGDSVLMGAGMYSPTLVDQLAANGWGPIRFQGVVGMSTGKFPVTAFARASYWVESWRNGGWDAPTVIVNVGSNDQGLCGGSYACARDSVLHLVNTIGPNRQIWWPLATADPWSTQRVGVWNSALRDVAAQRPNLHVWDWPQVMATQGFVSHDNVHLSPDGYRRRSAMMATEVTWVTARASRTGGDAPLPAPAAGASRYVTLPPRRITDTRLAAPGRRPARSTLRVDFGQAIPPGTTAVAINVTSAEPSDDGYLRAFPCGGSAGGSTVNYTRGVSRGAMTITPLGTRDDVCVYTHGQTDVVIDLQGAFVPPRTDPGSAGFVPRASPQRLHDTRRTGRRQTIVVPTPPSASAVAVNLTAVGGRRSGWLRAFPCGTSTGVSNVNFRAAEAVAGAAFVPTSENDTICVTSSTPVDVVVDLTGIFTTDGGLAFRPASPTRMVDTRDGTGGWSPIMGSDQTIDFRVAPSGARAVTGTVALIQPRRDGFATAFGCGGRPPTSSVNASPGVVLANSVTTGISGAGRLCLYSQRTSQVIFDTTGWWVP